MISIRPIFELSFWFDLFPNELSPAFEQGFFLFFALFIFAGAIVRVVSRRKEYDRDQRMILRKIAMLCSVMGLTGLLWLFLTYEQVYFFGARFWFGVWVITLAVWAYKLVKFVKVEVPAMKEARAMRQEVNAYIPKKRARK